MAFSVVVIFERRLRNLEELEALEAKFGGAGPQKKCGKERS